MSSSVRSSTRLQHDSWLKFGSIKYVRQKLLMSKNDTVNASAASFRHRACCSRRQGCDFVLKRVTLLPSSSKPLATEVLFVNRGSYQSGPYKCRKKFVTFPGQRKTKPCKLQVRWGNKSVNGNIAQKSLSRTIPQLVPYNFIAM